mmetsp:Transcript_4173/g.15000  ORF Transcript_4173/g.15000 Transcript_4173/m.15000 type:complete len:425 (+) Transcript_4173:127-1401(+)
MLGSSLAGSRRQTFKCRSRISDQEVRRRRALERQQRTRRDLTALARELALEPYHGKTDESERSQALPDSLGPAAFAGSGPTDKSPSSSRPVSQLPTPQQTWAQTQLSDETIREEEWGAGTVAFEGSKAVEMESLQTARGGASTSMDEGLLEPNRPFAQQEKGVHRFHYRRASTSAGQHPEHPQHGVHEFYSKQLMQPEWLLDIPANTATEWIVLPRPEGVRCLIIASGGSTVSRQRNGKMLHRFPSALPSGSRFSGSKSAGQGMYCILDCIFHERDQTYYVLDMMCWRGINLYDCSSEFRLFWVASKLAETMAGVEVGEKNRYRFAQVPCYPCTKEGLMEAYSGASLTFERDGLLLLNKHAHYQLGPTPLSLLWKDSACSKYFIDTDADGVVREHQVHVPAGMLTGLACLSLVLRACSWTAADG